MTRQLVCRLVFLLPSPRLELQTLAHYNTFLENLISINLYNWVNSKGTGIRKEIFVSLVSLRDKLYRTGILCIFTQSFTAVCSAVQVKG
jgi:hypothetical protein